MPRSPPLPRAACSRTGGSAPTLAWRTSWRRWNAGHTSALTRSGTATPALSWARTDANIACIRQLVDAGHEDRIIIGSDTGWYDPGFPAGFEVEQVDGRWTMVGAQAQDYRFIPEEFVPAMEAAGLPAALVRKLMHENPWSAFSR